MTLLLQDPQPSLSEVIRASKRFSAADRLLLAKALLDRLVLDGEQAADSQETFVEENVREDKAVVREREAFISLHPALLLQYPNEYVAIYQGQLVDHDPDGLALSLRVHQRFPDEFVWTAPLKAQAIEEWVIRNGLRDDANRRRWLRR
jgi:hypothetical protein